MLLFEGRQGSIMWNGMSTFLYETDPTIPESTKRGSSASKISFGTRGELVQQSRSQTQTTPAKIACKRSSLGLFGSGNETTSPVKVPALVVFRCTVEAK